MAEIVEKPEAPANDPDLARLVAALGGGPGDHSEPAPRDALRRRDQERAGNQRRGEAS